MPPCAGSPHGWAARALIVGALLGAALLTGCAPRPKPPPPRPRPVAHYVVGSPWYAAGKWHYPQEDFAYDATGLASVIGTHGSLTADGEAYDPGALAAAHPTLQLPSIARVTDLETGRQILLRINDRGPADPGRLIALTPRAAALLGIAPGRVAQVRVQLDAALSQRLADQLGGGPRLAIAAAPRGAVIAETLPPPGSPAAVGRAETISPGEDRTPTAPLPDRLPEQVSIVPADAGELWIAAGHFSRYEFAARVAAQLTGLDAEVLRRRGGRSESFSVRAGPFPTVAAADAALAEALRRGVAGARIVAVNPAAAESPQD